MNFDACTEMLPQKRVYRVQTNPMSGGCHRRRLG